MKKFALITNHFCEALKPNTTHSAVVKTPYGAPSCDLKYCSIGNQEGIIINRFGNDSKKASALINYKANIWALRDAGVDLIFAIDEVKSVDKKTLENELIIPNQLIDYTKRRKTTFWDMDFEESLEDDFYEPFSMQSRLSFIEFVTKEIKQDKNFNTINSNATLAILDGPRTPTNAELALIKKDGCDIYNMTSMPEAALARELKIEYVALQTSTQQLSSLVELCAKYIELAK